MELGRERERGSRGLKAVEERRASLEIPETMAKERAEEKRDGERERTRAKAAHGCCVLLHFVLTWCMRLLGNSPYAPFIYNSAANAGHASPHPRSVIRLRFAPLGSVKR